MTQALYLIRGVPGSGKTTRALQLIGELESNDQSVAHFEADQFFENENGEYQFNPAKLRHAHEWCRRQTRVALDDGDTVVVANTFTKNWEIEEYIEMGLAKIIPVHVIQCAGEWDNVHGVPAAKVQEMKNRFEDNSQLQKVWESHDRVELLSFE